MGYREPGTGRVEDRWTKRVKAGDGWQRVPSANDGKGKRWRVRWVNPDGVEETRNFERKAEADTWLREVTKRIRGGEYVGRANSRVKVGELYDDWEPTTIYLKERTRYNRKSIWRNHVEPYWSKKVASRVRKADVAQWVSDLHDSGTGVATIKQAMALLRLIFGYAVDAGVLHSNPAKNVRMPREEPPKRAYLNVGEVERLALEVERVAGRPVTDSRGNPVRDDTGAPVYVGGEQLGTLVRLLAYTGLRWGEATALRVDDVNFTKKRLHVRSAMSSVGGKIIEGTPKNHEQRTVPIPAVLVPGLKELVNVRARRDLLFSTSRGTPISGDNFRNRTWRPAIDAIRGVGGDDADQARTSMAPVLPEFPALLTPHDLRHTAASLAVSAGANVKALQVMLGHASASMTLDRYADLFDDDLDSVGVALDEIIVKGRRSQIRAV